MSTMADMWPSVGELRWLALTRRIAELSAYLGVGASKKDQLALKTAFDEPSKFRLVEFAPVAFNPTGLFCDKKWFESSEQR